MTPAVARHAAAGCAITGHMLDTWVFATGDPGVKVQGP